MVCGGPSKVCRPARIVASFGVGLSTGATQGLEPERDVGLGWPPPAETFSADIERRLSDCPYENTLRDEAQPDLPYIRFDLHRKGVSLLPLLFLSG